jgi:hypothetical protein
MPQDPWEALRQAAPAAPVSAPADPWAELRRVAPAQPTTSTGIVITDAGRPAPVNPLHTLAPAAMRVGGAIAGGTVGTALAPGIGTVGGSVAGGALGEWAAEGYETLTGQRTAINPTQIAAQGALNAIPFGTAAKGVSLGGRLLRGAAQGAAIGGVSDVATNLAEGRGLQAPSPASLGLGLVLGAAGGAAASRVPALRATPDAPAPPPIIGTHADEFGVVPPRPLSPEAQAASAAPPVIDDVDDMLRTLGVTDDAAARVQVDDPRLSMNNASGESAASMEALSRQASMRANGEGFVVYRPDGTKTPLIGPDAVDYQVRPGESYGIEGPEGFRLLDGPQPSNLAPRASNTAPIDAQASKDLTPIDLDPVRTPRETASPEAARLARVVNQDGLPPTMPIPEERRVMESMAARFPEDQRDTMLEIIEKNGAFEAQRRGVQTTARRQALAQHIEMDLSQKLRPGTILNAEETDHLAGVLTGVQERIKDLSTRVADGTATEWDRVALAQAKSENVTLLSSYLGTRAEQGRALQAHKYLTQILRSGDLDAVRQAMRDPRLRDVEGFAEEFLKRGDNPVAQMDYMREVLNKQTGLFDKALAVYYANILSGPKTHLRNLFGSTANIVFREFSSLPAAGFDAARSKLTGAPRTIYAGELPRRAVAAWQGMQKGLSDAAFVMKHGYSPDALQAFDTPRVELGGGAKNPFNIPGRLLEAEDQLMYRMVYEANVAGLLNARARQAAAKAGLTGAEADALIGQYMADNLLDVPKEVAAKAKAAGESALFREEPGKFIQWVLDKKNAGPIGKALSFVVPFVRVPGNIFRQALENNVVGMGATAQGRAALKAGGRESAELVGRAVTGTAALGLLASWVSQGRVSGGGPTNPNERAALMETGWKPYSVNVPGAGWVDFNLAFQSIALPLSMMANAWEHYQASGDEKALDDVVVTGVGSMVSTMLDQSFTAGVSDFNSAMTDPGRYMKSWLSRTGQGLVPLSGLQRNIAQTVDTTVRDVTDPSLVKQIGKGVQSIVPGASANLPAKLDRFGRPVERTGGRLAGISPVTVAPPVTDPVIRGLETLGIRSVGLPPRSIGREGSQVAPKQDLTTEDRAKMGQAVHAALSTLFASSLSQLQEMDPAAAEARVRRVVDDARARVRAEIQRDRRN